MRHFAHNIGDYAAATAHLSFIEDAAYHRLLRRYYQDEKPLPTALPDCQRLVGARTKEEREAVRVVLEEFFTLQDDGWHQSRADREIAGYRERAEIARRNGTKSAGRPKPTGNPSGYRVGYKSVPEDKPNPNQTDQLTTNHSPITNSVPNGTGADAPVDPVKALFDAGVDLLTKAGTTPQNARSLIGKWRSDYGNEAAMAAIGAANIAKVSEPVEWVTKYLANHAKPKDQQRGESWNDRRIREAMEAIRQ